MINYTIPKDIEKDAKVYMQNVLEQLDSTGMLENVDSAALTMLARNYSMFIKASKQLEDEGLTVTSDRGNIAPHPAIKKVMLEFGLTAKARTKLPKIEQDGYNPFEQFIKEGKETR